MNKNETMKSVDGYVRMVDILLVGAYNHMEDVKKALKKNGIHIKLALDLAQVNVASATRTLGCMVNRLKEAK